MVKQVLALIVGVTLLGIGGLMVPGVLLVALGVACVYAAVFVIDDGADA